MRGGKGKASTTSQEVWLTLEGVPRSQWGYAIRTEAQTIGRSPGCHIRVGDPTVSREHAVVWLKEGVPYIRDLESINGTRVNAKRIRTSVLTPGDLIQVGQIALRVGGASSPESELPGAEVASVRQTALVKASATAAGQYTTNVEEAKLREDLAAMYSLGGTLSLCSSRSEALHQLFDWMRTWLGVDQAAAIFHIDGQLKVTARSWSHGPPGPDQIYWPTVKACLAQRQLVSHELSRPRERGSGHESERPNHILAAWIAGATPPGVIYCEWLPGDLVWDKRCRELFDAAARILGEALTRLGGGGGKPRTDQDPGGSWMLNVKPDLIVGGAGMEPVREFIRRAAAVDANVLITGETGTGKELVARTIHQRSARAKRPFVARNCSAFAESLLEDELFGHEPGAFTGATKHRKGVFDQAHSGTLLMDEIADITPALQAKLLRVIEEQCFYRVGGQQPVHVDVRIIAATNRDLVQAVEAGQFRRDLFYRLEVLMVHLPPLRVRPGDVRALAEHFIDLASQRWNLPRLMLAVDAVRKLESHNWPGNVRELRNVIDRAVLLSEGAIQIRSEHILISQSAAVVNPSSKRIVDLEHEHILQVLASVGGNRARAASMLGIDRSTLLRKLRRFRTESIQSPLL